MSKSIQLKDSSGNIYPVTYTVESNQYGEAFKFSSGLMICKLNYTVTRRINNAWGNIYISSIINPPNYPVAFKNIPTYSISVNGTDGCWIMIDGKNYNSTKEHGPSFYLVRSNQALNTDVNFNANIIAIGVWK